MKPDVNPTLAPLLVPMSTLRIDENNAREHSERSIKAIVESLSRHGQQKPIVIKDGVIIAGNGTFQAAQRLCWDAIAAVEYHKDAAGHYALADNRSAELSTWDYEKLSSQLSLFEENPTGGLWSEDELSNLRQIDWSPPPAKDHDPAAFGLEKISLTVEEYRIVMEAVNRIKANMGNPEYETGRFVAMICSKYLANLLHEGLQQPILEELKKRTDASIEQLEMT